MSDRDALSEVLGNALAGGWDAADARDAGAYLAPIVARLIADAEARGAARGRNEAREAVVTYCDLSAQFAAEASPGNLAAAGLARAYRDVADKLRAALTTGDSA